MLAPCRSDSVCWPLFEELHPQAPHSQPNDYPLEQILLGHGQPIILLASLDKLSATSRLTTCVCTALNNVIAIWDLVFSSLPLCFTKATAPASCDPEMFEASAMEVMRCFDVSVIKLHIDTELWIISETNRTEKRYSGSSLRSTSINGIGML